MEWWYMVDLKIEREAALCERAQLTTTNADGTFTTYLNFTDVPTPTGPIMFRKIQISYINKEVLTFLDRIYRLFRQQIGLQICIKADYRCGSALIRIWALLRNSINSLKLDSPQTFFQLRQFHQDDVLQQCQILQHLDVVAVIPSMHSSSSEDNKNNSALFNWLHTPLSDVRPKILQCKSETTEGQEEFVLDELKWAFESVDFPSSYVFGLSGLYLDQDSMAEFSNGDGYKTFTNNNGEQLALISLDQNDKDGDIALERRPTSGLDEAQWNEWRRKASESFRMDEDSTNLVIVELYDEQICSLDGSSNSED